MAARADPVPLYAQGDVQRSEKHQWQHLHVEADIVFLRRHLWMVWQSLDEMMSVGVS